MTRMLLGETPVTVVLPGENALDDENMIVIAEELEQNGVRCCVTTVFNGKAQKDARLCANDSAEKEQTVCRLIYDQLTTLQGHPLPWGMLTGVRPVKLVRQMAEAGLSEDEIAQKLADYGVSPERIRLSLDTWHKQKEIIHVLSSDKVSLYVAIPFCPSRCSYCSFVSHSIERA